MSGSPLAFIGPGWGSGWHEILIRVAYVILQAGRKLLSVTRLRARTMMLSRGRSAKHRQWVKSA